MKQVLGSVLSISFQLQATTSVSIPGLLVRIIRMDVKFVISRTKVFQDEFYDAL